MILDIKSVKIYLIRFYAFGEISEEVLFMKQQSIINALAKKLSSGSDSFNVLIYQFKRQYPTHINLLRKIENIESRIGTKNEPTDTEIESIVCEILKV